jgi:hypothetical protein
MSTLTDLRFDDIDYGFRPESYWRAGTDPLAALLRNVKGKDRRRMIRECWEAGEAGRLDGALLEDEIDDGLRERLGCIHPSFMGGEYLPSYLVGEVEIARVDLASTLADVTGIRARPRPGGRIAYRVVDEYGTGFTISPKESADPLSQEELVRLIDGVEADDWPFSGSLGLVHNEGSYGGGDADYLRHFTTVSSDFYPALFEHFDRIHGLWVEECRASEAPGRG